MCLFYWNTKEILGVPILRRNGIASGGCNESVASQAELGTLFLGLQQRFLHLPSVAPTAFASGSQVLFKDTSQQGSPKKQNLVPGRAKPVTQSMKCFPLFSHKLWMDALIHSVPHSTPIVTQRRFSFGWLFPSRMDAPWTLSLLCFEILSIYMSLTHPFHISFEAPVLHWVQC